MDIVIEGSQPCSVPRACYQHWEINEVTLRVRKASLSLIYLLIKGVLKGQRWLFRRWLELPRSARVDITQLSAAAISARGLKAFNYVTCLPSDRPVNIADGEGLNEFLRLSSP